MSQASAFSTQAMNGSIASSTHPGRSARKVKKDDNDMSKCRVQDYLENDTPHSNWTTGGSHNDKQATQKSRSSMAGKLSAFEDAFHSQK